MDGIEDYRSKFYARYAETHVDTREGQMDVLRYERNTELMGKLYGHLFPADKSAHIIDIGCGYGAIVHWLQSAGYANTAGIDLDASQIAAGTALGTKNLSAGDFRSLLQQSKTFDVIVLRDVLEHFTKSEALELISQCHGALKTSGRLIVQVPNGDSPFFGRMRYGDFTHELAFTASSLSQLFLVCGFVAPAFHSVPPVTIGHLFVARLARALAWQLAQAVYRMMLSIEAGTKTEVVTMNIVGVAYRGER